MGQCADAGALDGNSNAKPRWAFAGFDQQRGRGRVPRVAASQLPPVLTANDTGSKGRFCDESSPVSVRAYPHYYIPWIPVSVLLIGFFAYILDSMARVVYIHEKNRLAPFLLPAFIMVIGFQPLFAIALISLSVDVQRQKTVEYVQDHTSNMDSILIWGSEASIHFLTHRQAPTRFFYQYPLYMSGFTRPALIDELLIDLRTRKPKLIIDSKNCEAPLTRSFARECYELGQMQRYGVTYPSGLDKLNEYIASNYTLVDHIGPEEWPVFVYEGPPH